jgi:class 3 adenylate cyclase
MLNSSLGLGVHGAKGVERCDLAAHDEHVRALPSGTVTFLFTDIEGSTRLIEELGEERYVDALAEHRRLLREAFSAHAGVEVDTQGDAFLYAFENCGWNALALPDPPRAEGFFAIRWS